ncbi:hypothetical protein [Cellulomonas sp.]|uniref:hypothetical protein n=1 Tax=Cellulomonas sp. TaxID=40001 RepID=UPI001B25E1B7|nr:hypothetical protein [Cellulomonas sp.]MBO9553825.1 hypothetical protein [Cellulomonas sp.]
MALLSTVTATAARIVTAIPDPDAVQPPGTEGFTAIMGWAKWIALAVCVLGLIGAGALMAVQSRRGEGGEHVGKIGMALGGVIVISAAGSLVGFLMSA